VADQTETPRTPHWARTIESIDGEWAARYAALQVENERLQVENRVIVAARAILERDREFQEWAQGHLDAAKWAGHDRSDAVRQELLAAEGEAQRLREALTKIAAIHITHRLYEAQFIAKSALSLSPDPQEVLPSPGTYNAEV